MGLRFTHVAGLLATTLLAACAAPAPSRVVLISIDTCRVDHLSVYGYARPTSPFLEQLAARGVRFDEAFAQATDTTPSHASLFTSTYPFRHAAANGVPLDDRLVTVAEILRDHGFRTAAFVSGWTMTAEASGLDRGFETYDDTLTHIGTSIARQPNERRAESTTDRALEWLSSHADERYFLFVHYFDPHARYDPPSPYDTMFPVDRSDGRRMPVEQIPPYARLEGETDPAVYIARYDAEIRYVDDQIRRLIESLDAAGALDETLVVVIADHGESLTEHGLHFAHGWNLFDPSLHIPLIVSYPRALPQGRSVAGLVQSIDVMPTILDLLDLPLPAEAAGASLLPRIEGAVDDDGFAVAKTTKELTYLGVGEQRDLGDHYAVRTREWKYLHEQGGSKGLLFDLRADPGETRNVIDREPAHAARLRELLGYTLLDSEVDDEGLTRELDESRREELERRLRGLGYIR